MTYEGAYIRPCAAFPDGYELPDAVLPQLLRDGLIEPASPDVDNRHEKDYAAIYGDDDMEAVAYDIVLAVREHIAPWSVGR
jgi:hypothetical protein